MRVCMRVPACACVCLPIHFFFLRACICMCVCIMHTHVHTHTGVLRTGVPGDQTPHPRAAECTQMCHKANGQGLLQVAGQPNPCIPCAHAYTPGVLGTAFRGSSPLLMCCVCVCVCVCVLGGWLVRFHSLIVAAVQRRVASTHIPSHAHALDHTLSLTGALQQQIISYTTITS